MMVFLPTGLDYLAVYLIFNKIEDMFMTCSILIITISQRHISKGKIIVAREHLLPFSFPTLLLPIRSILKREQCQQRPFLPPNHHTLPPNHAKPSMGHIRERQEKINQDIIESIWRDCYRSTLFKPIGTSPRGDEFQDCEACKRGFIHEAYGYEFKILL